ncbi:MAG: hypothetical protein WCK76_10890, partial [Elusimicrobiota bacterium]
MAILKPDFKRLSAFLWLNFGLSLAVCSLLLFFTGGHPLEMLYTVTALVSNTVMLYAALAVPAAVLFLLPRGRGALCALLAAF